MKLTPEIKRDILDALEQWKGDDLERAECAFRRCTQEEMQQQHGQSGRTRQQVLDAYRSHRTRVNDAIQWIKGQDR